jgi:hypothetical protein
MLINKTCKTCEFNFDGVCAGEEVNNYGEIIMDSSKECEDWGISLEYFSEVIDNMPWYVKGPYNRGKICFEEALQKLEEDETEKGTEINIYDAIAMVYGIPWWELGEILGVKSSVIGYATCRGTIPRRKKQFASILRIPEEYFDVIYSKQLCELEKSKKKFYSHYGDVWIMQMREQARKKLK